MRLIEFYNFIIKEYILLWIPFVVGLGMLINSERGENKC